MNMKSIFAGMLLAASGLCASQEVELKNGQATLDGNPLVRYEKINALQYSFYNGSDDEILFWKNFDNGTPQYLDDDYFVVNFLGEKIKVESSNFTLCRSGLGLNSEKNMKKLLATLVKEKVLRPDGTIDPDRASVFHDKYDEKITDRTVRY